MSSSVRYNVGSFAVKAGLARLADSWNRRVGGIILAFHEISEKRLSTHLAAVSELYEFVSLTEFTRRLAQGKATAGLAAVTFDDGYAGVVESAARLAREHACPMTFYLPTRYLDSREPFWYQELKPLLARAQCHEATIAGVHIALHDKPSIAAAYKNLNQRFRAQPTPAEINLLLRETRRALIGDEERPADLATTPPISWERVGELAKRDELSFESHTVNHLALSCLTKEGIRAEMSESCARIEEATGRPVRHFCYPFGGTPEVNETARAVARELFSSATTMIRGRCRTDSDTAALPRVPLYEGDTAEIVKLKVGFAR